MASVVSFIVVSSVVEICTLLIHDHMLLDHKYANKKHKRVKFRANSPCFTYFNYWGGLKVVSFPNYVLIALLYQYFQFIDTYTHLIHEFTHVNIYLRTCVCACLKVSGFLNRFWIIIKVSCKDRCQVFFFSFLS